MDLDNLEANAKYVFEFDEGVDKATADTGSKIQHLASKQTGGWQ